MAYEFHPTKTQRVCATGGSHFDNAEARLWRRLNCIELVRNGAAQTSLGGVPKMQLSSPNSACRFRRNFWRLS